MADISPELRTLTLSGTHLTFHCASGEVVGDKRWAETHVHSSGGGGYVGQQGGYVAAPSVSSTIVTRSEIWLRDSEGREFAIKGSNLGFPVREGQQVTAVWATDTAGKKNIYVILVNHSSAQTLILPSGAERVLASLPKDNAGCLTTISICTAIVIGAIALGETTVLWSLAIVALLYLARIARIASKQKSFFSDHVERIAAELT